MADINLKPEQVAGKVPELREAFKKKHAESISKGKYDQRDLDRLEKDDAYARCFLRTLKSNGDVAKTVPIIDECFKFRKEIGIWDLTEESFDEELTKRNGMYYKNHDKDHHPILYVDVKANTSTTEQIPMLKKYITFILEKHHRADPEQMVVCLFDMSSAGTGNMNTTVSKFFIASFAVYFPGFLAYMINYEMPTILNAVWTIIKTFMNKDQSKKVVIAKKKDLPKYIPVDQLWPHMK